MEKFGTSLREHMVGNHGHNHWEGRGGDKTLMLADAFSDGLVRLGSGTRKAHCNKFADVIFQFHELGLPDERLVHPIVKKVRVIPYLSMASKHFSDIFIQAPTRNRPATSLRQGVALFKALNRYRDVRATKYLGMKALGSH